MKHVVRLDGNCAVCGTVRTPYFEVDGAWVVQGVSGEWPTRIAARNAARTECLRRFNPLEDLLIHVLRGRTSLEWVMLHECAGDAELQPWVRNADHALRHVLNLLYGDQSFSLNTVDNPIEPTVRGQCRLALEGGVTIQVVSERVYGLEFAPRTRERARASDEYNDSWLSDLEGRFEYNRYGHNISTPEFRSRECHYDERPSAWEEDVRDKLEELFGSDLPIVTI